MGVLGSHFGELGSHLGVLRSHLGGALGSQFEGLRTLGCRWRVPEPPFTLPLPQLHAPVTEDSEEEAEP